MVGEEGWGLGGDYSIRHTPKLSALHGSVTPLGRWGRVAEVERRQEKQEGEGEMEE